MSDSPNKIQWHPAFYAATELELRANASELSFMEEFDLSKMPLKVDLLVVKKVPGARIVNEIGHIFKGHNIIEYKSPDDGLTIDDFFKVASYAGLYKALAKTVNEIPEEEITISLFREACPEELFAMLKASGREIIRKYPGIYYVTGRLMFDTQVVVTGELEGKEHSTFRILSRHASEEDVRNFIDEAGGFVDSGERNNVEAVLNVSVSANDALYDWLRRDLKMSDALENLMRDVIEERERKAAEAAAEAAEAAAKATTQNYINNLMSNLGMSAEQVMNAMRIPTSEQASYMKKIG